MLPLTFLASQYLVISSCVLCSVISVKSSWSSSHVLVPRHHFDILKPLQVRTLTELGELSFSCRSEATMPQDLVSLSCNYSFFKVLETRGILVQLCCWESPALPNVAEYLAGCESPGGGSIVEMREIGAVRGAFASFPSRTQLRILPQENREISSGS